MSRAVAPILALSLAGCATHVYRPAAAVEGGEPALRLAPVWLQVTPRPGTDAVEARVAVESAATWKVSGAWLAPEASPPCEGGIQATHVTVAGRQLIALAQHELSPASGELRLVFPARAADAASPLGAGAAVLDVAVAPADDPGDAPRCVRTPVVSAARTPRWVDEPRWSVEAHGRALAASPGLRGLRSVVGGGVGGAVLAGPVRLGLDADVGRGAVEASSGLRGAYVTTAAATVGAPVATLGRGERFRGALLAEAGWTIGVSEGDLGGGKTDAAHLLHGPRAALRLALVPGAPGWPGFEGRPDPRGVSMDLLASRWWSPGGGASWIFGIGLTAFGGL